MSKETDVARCFLDIVDVLKNDIVTSLVTLKSTENTGINEENFQTIIDVVVSSTEKAKDFGVDQLTYTVRK